MLRLFKKDILSWSMYDWANSAFSTTVMAGFFPVFFKQYWSLGVDPTVSTARLGMANAVAGTLVALAAPVLGAVADQGSMRKKFLILFALLGVCMTLGLFWVNQGQWFIAVFLFVIAVVGFSGANIFYDSLLPAVAREKQLDTVSTLGYSLGYIGGGLLFALNVAMTLRPGWFGLANAAAAVRFSFLTVALWWALFTIPLVLYVREPRQTSPLLQTNPWSAGFLQLAQTFREIKRLRPILLFLLAYWLYIDGVYTMILMAVDYGMSIGLASNDLIIALLITQFVGFPAALGFGILSGRIGVRASIYMALAVYCGVSVYGALMQSATEFYILAIVIGLAQGGIQALSRSYYAKMIPLGKSAEYFGFYNMLGKFAAIMGPLLMGSVGIMLTAAGLDSLLASRISIISISLLLISGGVLFYFARPNDR